MADEYRVAWLGTEVLNSDSGDIQISFVGAEVVNTDSGDGQLAWLGTEVVNSIQAPLWLAALYVEVMMTLAFKVSPVFIDETAGDTFLPIFTDEIIRLEYVEEPADEIFPPSVQIEAGSIPYPDIPAEWNPYRPDIPPQIADDSVTYEYMREQAELLRTQHDLIQAGDTTFLWEIAVRKADSAAFTLGSLGRFKHADYGLIQARFVKFSENWGLAVRPFVGQQIDADEWVVTNDPAETSQNRVRGVSMCFENNLAGYWGWIQTQGPGTFDLQMYSDRKPEDFERFTWSQTDTRVASLDSGHAVGYVISAADVSELVKDDLTSYTPKRWSIPAANWMVDVAGFTRAYYEELITEGTANLVAEVEALQAAVSALESQDYDTAIAALQQAQTVLTQQLQFEARARNTTDANLNQKIELLNQAVTDLQVAGSLTPDDLLALQNQVNINTSNISGLTAAHGARLTMLETWKAAAQASIDALLIAVSTSGSMFVVADTGTGASQDILLPINGLTAEQVLVFVNGLRWPATEYSVTGDLLTITSNAAGDSIEIVRF